jgi:hypothetical protein
MATTRPLRTYTAAPDPRAADRDPSSRSSSSTFAATGAVGRTALRRTATAAAVVVCQRDSGFRFMIFTLLCELPDYSATMLPARGCFRLK